MSAVSRVLRSLEGNQLSFWCPGCKIAHAVRVSPAAEPWGYNGNPEAPTFTPSILVRWKDFTEKGESDYRAWVAGGHQPLPDGHAFETSERICHSFVTDGKIQFLSDCTHALAGQVVALPDFP